MFDSLQVLISGTILLGYLVYRIAWHVYLSSQGASLRKKFEQKGFKVMFIPQTFQFAGFNEMPDPSPNEPFYYDHDICISPYRGKNVVVIMNQDLIKQFFATKNEDWVKEGSDNNNTIRTTNESISFGNPEYWRKRRAAISKAFQGSLMGNMMKLTVEICNRRIGGIGKLKDYKKFFNYITVEAIVRGYFGFSVEEFFDYKMDNEMSLIDYHEVITVLLGFQMMDWGYKYFGRKFVELGLRQNDAEVIRRLNTYTQEIGKLIKKKEKQLRSLSTQELEKKQKCILEELIISGVLSKLSIQEIVHEFNSMLDNFEDAIDQNASNALLQLETQENKWANLKLRDQIRQYIKSDADITPETFTKMRFLNAVVTETLRIDPLGNNLAPRTPTKPITIGGVQIGKDVIFLVNQHSLAMNPKYWKDPIRFNPNRFTDQSSPQRKNLLIPFSGGERNCVGRPYADLVTKCILVKMMNHRHNIY